MKTKLTSKMTALIAAGALLLSGASALAATAPVPGDTPTVSKADAAAQKKCRKKNKKKCKKASTGFVPGCARATYMGPAVGGADTPAVNPWGLIAPVNFIPGAGETQAMIEIIDDLTPRASAGFSYDSDGDGLNDTTVDVCGETPEPVEVIPGTQYNVFPYLLPSTSCSDGIATSGTIIVTFNEV